LHWQQRFTYCNLFQDWCYIQK